MLFHILKNFPSVSNMLGVFLIMNEYWKVFSTSIDKIIWLFLFSLVIYWIILIYFQISNQPCHSLMMILLLLLYIAGFNLLKFAEDFCICLWGILGCTLPCFLLLSLFDFSISIMLAPWNKLENISSSSIIWKRLYVVGVISSLNIW